MEKPEHTDSKPFIPHTPLAKQLWKLRQEVLASHTSLLSLEEIRQEVQERRGGVQPEEEA
jgi:hypothetical protein